LYRPNDQAEPFLSYSQPLLLQQQRQQRLLPGNGREEDQQDTSTNTTTTTVVSSSSPFVVQQQWSKDALQWHESALLTSTAQTNALADAKKATTAKNNGAGKNSNNANGTSSSSNGRNRRNRLKRPRSYDERTTTTTSDMETDAAATGSSSASSKTAPTIMPSLLLSDNTFADDLLPSLSLPTFYRRPTKRSNTSNTTKQAKQAMSMLYTEQDEAILEYQWAYHQQPPKPSSEEESSSGKRRQKQPQQQRQAEWKLIVDLTAGRSISTLRNHRRRNNKRRLEEESAEENNDTPSSSSSGNDNNDDDENNNNKSDHQPRQQQSWREIYEEQQIDRITGDYRRSPASHYPYETVNSSSSKLTSGNAAAAEPVASAALMSPKMMTTRRRNKSRQKQQQQKKQKSSSSCSSVSAARPLWRAVWAAGQAMQRQISLSAAANNSSSVAPPTAANNNNNGKKQQAQENCGGDADVYLSDIIALLSHAYALPPPEEVFQDTTIAAEAAAMGSTSTAGSKKQQPSSTATVVEAIDVTMRSLLDACRTAQQEQARLLDLWYEEGIDADVLRKHLDALQMSSSKVAGGSAAANTTKLSPTAPASLAVQLDIIPNLRQQVQVVTLWQSSVDTLLKACSGNGSSSSDPETNGKDCDKELRQARNDLILLEKKLAEARNHTIRSKVLVALENKLERAYQLRDKIRKWQQSTFVTSACNSGDEDSVNSTASSSLSNSKDKESLKFVSSVVRDITRLKLVFPETVSMLEFHRLQESWVDRATIAIRSRISLQEIKSLIQTGQDLPVDVSDYLEKLLSRVSVAEDWLERFQKAVPPPPSKSHNKDATQSTKDKDNSVDDNYSGNLRNISPLQWMERIRQELNTTEGRSELHYLANEGIRIPVDVDFVKLLQVEMDARNWTAKVKKWLPTCNTAADNNSGNNKKGKLEDLREYQSKGVALREMLVLLSEEERKAWVLEGESELSEIVDAADDWLDSYDDYLSNDNRRGNNDSDDRVCVSLPTLRRIVSEANLIYANLGNVHTKISKVLTQAEAWHEKYTPLLVQCNLQQKGATEISSNGSTERSQNDFVNLKDLTAAADEALSDVSYLDLDESVELTDLVTKIKTWFNHASVASGKKRQRRGKRNVLTFTVADVQSLINQATSLPVDCSEEVAQLEESLSAIRSSQSRAAQDLTNICDSFDRLRQDLSDAYGPPSEFSQHRAKRKTSTGDSNTIETDDKDDTAIVADGEGDSVDSPGEVDSASSTSGSSIADNGTTKTDWQLLIKAFLRENGRFSCIVTPIGETAGQLETISRWCAKSIQHLETQRNVFDKRFFGAFDRLVSEGTNLFKLSCEKSSERINNGEETSAPDGTSSSPVFNSSDTKHKLLLRRLCSSWGGVIADQNARLYTLMAERKQFCEWCDNAEQILFSNDGKTTSIKKLTQLSAESYKFSDDIINDSTVQKVRSLTRKTNVWIENTSKRLDECETTKLAMHEAKAMCEEGGKLRIQCAELSLLRNAIKEARSFANRVKRCKVDQGKTQMADVRALLDEYDSLFIEMPDEGSKLQKATKNYCLCRRPYEGFMIGCDECDEWFHGPCVGVSESRADKVNKYVCIRCCLKRCYKGAASNVVTVIRKWTNKKDLKKQRTVESQKHQRKVRKETKDIEKFEEGIKSMREKCDRIQNGLACAVSSSGDPAITDTSNSGDVTGATPGDSCSCGAIVETCRDNPSQKATGAAPAHATTTEAVSSDGTVTDKASIDVNSQSRAAGIEEGETVGSLNSKIEKAVASVEQCRSRLSALADAAVKRKNQYALEDSKVHAWKLWCVRVRSLVLAPSSLEQAQSSCPNLRDGSLSTSMISIIGEASILGLQRFKDVDTVLNAFKAMAWCLRAMKLLSRQATCVEMQSLVFQASSIKLPDDKAAAMMRKMAQRASSWENKTSRALTPVPGETKPFNMENLKELSHAADDIPLCMRLEPRLSTVIEDKGARHCVCGGPSDGRFMLSCDNCNKWFHGHCVGISKEESENLDVWKCPACEGNPPDVNSLDLDMFHDNFEIDTDLENSSHGDDDADALSTASNSKEMWPPYGLFLSHSTKILESFGEACCAIPDNTGNLISPTQETPLKDWQPLQKNSLKLELHKGTKCPAPPVTGAEGVGLGGGRVPVPPPITSMPQMARQGMRQLHVEDALIYLDEVKREFKDNPHVYNEFLAIMKTFKMQAVDHTVVMTHVSQLFRGYDNLIIGFSRFLPQESSNHVSPAVSSPPAGSKLESSEIDCSAPVNLLPGSRSCGENSVDRGRSDTSQNTFFHKPAELCNHNEPVDVSPDDTTQPTSSASNSFCDKDEAQISDPTNDGKIVTSASIKAPDDARLHSSADVINRRVHKIDPPCPGTTASSLGIDVAIAKGSPLRYSQVSSELMESDDTQDMYRTNPMGTVVRDVLVAPIKENGYD